MTDVAATRASMLELQTMLLDKHDDIDTDIIARRVKILGQPVDVLLMSVNKVISVIITTSNEPVYYITSPIYAGKKFDDKLKAFKHVSEVIVYHSQNALLLNDIDESVS